MGIDVRVLGNPGSDNAAFVKVDDGQRVARLLFDCGENVLAALPEGEVRAIDFVLFSHLHLDHAAGFDYLLRRNYARESKPTRIWGPEGTAERIQHRFLGFVWNLLDEKTPGEFLLTDVASTGTRTFRLLAREGYRTLHPAGSSPFSGDIYDEPNFRIECRIVDHLIPCLAYGVAEKDKVKIDAGKLASASLRSGEWCARLKDPERSDAEAIEIDGVRFRLGELRGKLLRTERGRKASYVTDLSFTPETKPQLVDLIRGSDVLVAECSYRQSETELARAYRHLTTRQVAELAAEADVGELVLMHVSDRYREPERAEMLREVREVFRKARFPESW